MSTGPFVEPRDAASDRQIAELRIPPHSVEAESSVLGGLLLDNAAWDRVGDLLTGVDLFSLQFVPVWIRALA